MAVANANEKTKIKHQKVQAKALAENNQKFNASSIRRKKKLTKTNVSPGHQVALGAAAVGLFFILLTLVRKFLNTQPGEPVSLGGFQLWFLNLRVSWNGSI